MSKPKFVSTHEKKMQKAFRILVATLLVCGALSLGSIMGVTAQTFNASGQRRVAMNPFTVVNQGRQGSDINTTPLDPASLITGWFTAGELERRTNILILGSDYNYSYGKRIDDKVAGVRSRTDTIMLASLDPDTHQVSILSIPRDTRTLLTGYHYDKINAAMTYGGVDLVKSTVSDLIGVPIDYYMALKVDGLVNTIDILGGIRIYVEKDMYYVDETAHLGINIHKGWKENMNGEQAHQYIRFRKDELGDIGRVQRQQKFIRAVLDKLLQPQTFLKVPELLAHLNENIETDLPSDEIVRLAKFSRNLDKDKVRMVMLPGTFANISGISYWEPNLYATRKIITQMFPDSSFALANTSEDLTDNTNTDASENNNQQYRVAIWNATKDLPTVREVSRRLQEAGYQVVSVRRAPHDTPVTKLIAQNGETDVLPQIQQELGFKSEFVSASVGDLTTDFTVLIGPDLVKHYHKVLTEEDWKRASKQYLSNNVLMQDAPRRQQRYVKPSRAATRRAPRQVTATPAQVAPAQTGTSRDLASNLDELGIAPSLPETARAGKLQRTTTQTASTPMPVVPQNDYNANTVDPLFD